LLDEKAQRDSRREQPLAVPAAVLGNQAIERGARNHLQQSTTRTIAQQGTCLLDRCAKAFFW